MLAAASSAHAQNSNGRLVIGATVVAPCQVSFVAGLARATSASREPDVSCPQSDAFETKYSSATVTMSVGVLTPEAFTTPPAAAPIASPATAKLAARDLRGGAAIDVRIVEVAF